MITLLTRNSTRQFKRCGVARAEQNIGPLMNVASNSFYSAGIELCRSQPQVHHPLQIAIINTETKRFKTNTYSTFSIQHPTLIETIPSPQLGSIRYMGRRDGNKAFFKPRKPSRKKQKRQFKKMQERYHEKVGKHSPHGLKMRAKRDQMQMELDMVLDSVKGVTNRYLPEPNDMHGNLEYNEGDAMVDDLIGNTAHLTSTPTPKPVKIGKYHSKNLDRVKRKMDAYYKQKQILESSTEKKTEEVGSPLPTDTEISQLVRSFRDKYGSRRKPVGIAKVLQLLLVDLRIPSTLFREKSYTSLMTCATHPKEAVRIMQLMDEHNQPKTSYVYSILVDLYAKKGDFRSARKTIDDMSLQKITPTLPAYTSLLAACFKIVNRGNAPHKLKAEAGKIGWESWKEMRIIGIEADVMAYGAIIRLCAARGQAEKCLSLMDEMKTFGILPTTLIFTSALRGVAKSHENALRFEGGYSPKNKRREKLCSYFGKLTREILIKAENAEVQHDEGFIAALILCAAAAGDSATAKAIFLASEVRKMTYLRTIGSDEHLLRLQGDFTVTEDTLRIPTDSQNPSTMQLQTIADPKKKEGDNEKDTRIYTALLLAYANSMKSRGLGNVWQGHENKGYLCETSLNIITKHREPVLHDNSIPGLSSTEVGFGSMTYEPEDPDRMSKKLRRKKFEGMDQDPNVGNTLDELDEELFRMYDGIPNDLTGIDPEGYNFHSEMEKRGSEVGILGEIAAGQSMLNDPSNQIHDELGEMNFSAHAKFDPAEERHSFTPTMESRDGESSDELIDNDSITIEENLMSKDEIQPTGKAYLEDYHNTVTDLLSENFNEFYEGLLKEIQESGEEIEPDEAEVKELYEMMKKEQVIAATVIREKNEEEMDSFAQQYEAIQKGWNDFNENYENERDEVKDVESFAADLMEMSDEYSSEGFQNSSQVENEKPTLDIDANVSKPKLQEEKIMEFTKPLSDYGEQELAKQTMPEIPTKDSKILDMDRNVFEIKDTNQEMSSSLTSPQYQRGQLKNQNAKNLLKFHEDGEPKDELDFFLEGMPQSRIKNVRKIFSSTLGDPSLLRLVPILRENLPSHLTMKWLREANVRHANQVLSALDQENSVDIHVLNGMLQVQTSASNLADALQFHEDAETKYGITPNQYSDRLIVDMLVKNKEIEKALEFKQKIESKGRRLDILSYGLLMEYYANRENLEPALSLLKETISIHKYPPGEKSLSKIRLICRQRDIEKEVGLVEMIGEDPVQWFRHGEQNLRREFSKKGNRTSNEIRNLMTRI